jgi:NAD-dependent SIR2 family protein deacetylase
MHMLLLFECLRCGHHAKRDEPARLAEARWTRCPRCERPTRPRLVAVSDRRAA